MYRRAILAIPVVFHTVLAAATLPASFSETQFANGISNGTAMAFAPDGRLFVCQQGGQLRVIKNGALLAAPFVTVSVDSSGERGLLGIAFDPNFAANSYVYIYYTTSASPIHNRVSRFTANGDVAVANSETVLLDLDNLSNATNHNGGAIHFGPDGKLYIAAGENANGANAQTMTNLLGKILRINNDGTIPTDNPFYNTATGKNRAIWAYGLRNPFTFAFQPGTGRMFINDVGNVTWEEIDDGIVGSNYGWPATEGFTNNPQYRSPLFEYGHGSGSMVGCAIVGGTFYNPPTMQFPVAYRNTYFFADFCSGWIRRMNPADNSVSDFASGISSPVDVAVGADGALYYLARGAGAVYKVTYAGDAAPTADAVSPNSGSGATQTFNFTYSDANGATDLNVVYALFNSTLNGSNSCLPAYSRFDNKLYLFTDNATAVLGPITPGTGSVQNTQCTLNGAASSVSSNANSLTVNLALSFQPFFAGAKTIYMLAADMAGIDSGWQTRGTWTGSVEQAPSVLSIAPNSGSGANPSFAVTFADPNGFADLTLGYLLVNGGLDGANACFPIYSRPANTLYLVNDAGNGLVSGSLTPLGGGSLSNAQCTLNAAGSSVSAGGNNLTVTYALSLNAAFGGRKTTFGMAADGSGNNSGWQTLGTWSRAPNSTPAAVSVSPNAGTGANQVFTFTYSDADGFGDLSVQYGLFNSALNGAGACFVAYNRPANVLYLVADSGVALVPGSVTPGAAGSLSNSQCTISSGGVATANGNGLTVPVTVQFTPAFSGARSTFGLATDASGAMSAWQSLGSWNVP